MKQNTRDDGDLKKYYATIPHMADDELDPYQYRLYGHYKRVCGQEDGECWESVKTTSKACKMSTGMVTKTRNELQKMGYIEVEKGANDNDTCNITIVDRWAENMNRYSKRSYGERTVHTVNDSVHVVKQRITQEEQPIKNEKKKEGTTQKPLIPTIPKTTPPPQYLHPFIEVYVNVFGSSPNKEQRQVLNTMPINAKAIEVWESTLKLWSMSGWRKQNVEGQLDKFNKDYQEVNPQKVHKIGAILPTGGLL